MAKQKKTAIKDTDADKVEKDFIGSKEDTPEDRSISSRNRYRSQLDDDIASFLASGGEIKRVERNITADPPQKPTSSYGSRPI